MASTGDARTILHRVVAFADVLVTDPRARGRDEPNQTKEYETVKSHIAMLIFGATALLYGAAPAAAAAGPTSGGWGDGEACAVIAADDVRCYTTYAEMERATTPEQLGETGAGHEGIDDASVGAALMAGYCNGRSDLWVYLYEFSGYGGRVLKFRDAGI